MFKDTIRGLDKVFETDIRAPKTILVTGPPGSMKTTFVHALISNYLKAHPDEYAFYATLEESTESLLEGLESAKIELSMNMNITDFTDIRGTTESEQVDYLAFMENVITHYKAAYGDAFTVFAMDSLGALYSLTPDLGNMRVKMYNFFRMLRQNRLYSFILMERSPRSESQLLGNEGFLADGIILLGLDLSKGRLVRYVQIEKMRSVRHTMEKHGIDITDGGFRVLRPLFE